MSIVMRCLLLSITVCYNASMSKYTGQTPARRKANTKYLHEKVDSIAVRVPKGTKELLREAAEKENKSLNQYCADILMDSLHSGTDT